MLAFQDLDVGFFWTWTFGFSGTGWFFGIGSIRYGLSNNWILVFKGYGSGLIGLRAFLRIGWFGFQRTGWIDFSIG